MTAKAFSPFGKYRDLDCLDAGDNAHFSRELETILPDLTNFEKAPLSVRSLFPVNTSFAPMTESITWRMLTTTGAAKIIADYADDVPLINLFGEEKTTKVRTLAAAHWFSIQEIEGSTLGTISLTTEGPLAARDEILRLENSLAYNGSTKFNQVGLFSGTAVTGIAQTAAAAVWTTALPQGQIYGEMAALVRDVKVDSKTVHGVTRMLMSPDNFSLVSTTQFSTASDTTILGYFRANHPGVEVMEVQELSLASDKGGLAGTAGNDAVFVYNPNPSEIFLAVPMAIAQRPPFENNLKVKTIYWSRTGGFIIRKPLAMKFLTGT